MAYRRCETDGKSEEHIHDYDEYIVVVQGMYSLIMDGEKVQLYAGREYFIPKGSAHAGILKNPDAIRRIVTIIDEVRPLYPEDHLKEILKGGYRVELGTDYSSLEKYFIRTFGHWMDALASGTVSPYHPALIHFVQVCRGEKSPEIDIETAWLKFNRDYPDRTGLR